MRPRIRIALALPAVLATVALLVVQAPFAQARGDGHVYKPPYKKGAQGGDSANFMYSDPSSGTVGVLRAYPGFNPFTCGSSHGGWVTLRVPIKVTRPIASVEFDYSNALVDTYSFLTVTLKRGDTYVGSKDVRGPLFGSGKVNVPIDLGSAPVGSTIQANFGVLTPSACPNVELAEAQFTQVVTHEA
jgi:hypothetical protein